MPLCAEVSPETPEPFALPYLPDVRAAYGPQRPLIAEIGASILLRLLRLRRYKAARCFAELWRATPNLQAALDLAERLQVLPEPAAALAGRCQSLSETFLRTEGAFWGLYGHEYKKFDEYEWLRAVEATGHPEQVLGHIPLEQRSEAICRLAVSIQGYSLRQVPKELLSLELCEMALRNGSGIVLHYVPVTLQRLHPHLWKLALRRDAAAFKYLPVEHKTQPRLRKLIGRAPELIELLTDEREKVDTARAALPHYGNALLLIPAKERTREDCLRALASGAPVASEISQTLYWDEELVEVAVLSNAAALKVVPTHLVTPELLSRAARESHFRLDYVPHQRRSKTLCRLAVEHNAQNLADVPKRSLDVAMMVSAIRRGGPWQALPEELRQDPEVREALLQHATWAWTTFAHTEEHWATILQHAPQALLACHQHIPESLRRPETYDRAVRSKLSSGDFGRLPTALRTPGRCADALQNGATWKEVPRLLRYFDKRP